MSGPARAEERECRCTALLGTPTMFVDLLNEPRLPHSDLSALRKALVSGARCPPRLCQRIRAGLGLSAFHKLYGTTECGPAAFMSYANEELDTVGQVLDHLEAQVVGERGQKLERGAEGELLLRGYSLMSGYWSEPVTEKKEKNKGVPADRWYRTG